MSLSWFQKNSHIMTNSPAQNVPSCFYTTLKHQIQAMALCEFTINVTIINRSHSKPAKSHVDFEHSIILIVPILIYYMLYNSIMLSVADLLSH